MYNIQYRSEERKRVVFYLNARMDKARMRMAFDIIRHIDCERYDVGVLLAGKDEEIIKNIPLGMDYEFLPVHSLVKNMIKISSKISLALLGNKPYCKFLSKSDVIICFELNKKDELFYRLMQSKRSKKCILIDYLASIKNSLIFNSPITYVLNYKAINQLSDVFGNEKDLLKKIIEVAPLFDFRYVKEKGKFENFDNHRDVIALDIEPNCSLRIEEIKEIIGNFSQQRFVIFADDGKINDILSGCPGNVSVTRHSLNPYLTLGQAGMLVWLGGEGDDARMILEGMALGCVPIALKTSYSSYLLGENSVFGRLCQPAVASVVEAIQPIIGDRELSRKLGHVAETRCHDFRVRAFMRQFYILVKRKEGELKVEC